MSDPLADQRQYWNELARLDRDAAVIDPADRRGVKNAYLAGIRNDAVAQSLRARQPRIVLDLGCGTGSLGGTLLRLGCHAIGLDIAPGLLARVAERGLGDRYLPVLYDGWRFPLRDGSVDAVVTYVVLTHVVDDRHLARLLAECHRVLASGGTMVAIEQVRTRARSAPAAHKRFRTLADYRQHFSLAGLRPGLAEIVRYGHAPWIYPIRFGWVPQRLFPAFARLERWLGRRLAVLPWDYCDVRFEVSKP